MTFTLDHRSRTTTVSADTFPFTVRPSPKRTPLSYRILLALGLAVSLLGCQDASVTENNAANPVATANVTTAVAPPAVNTASLPSTAADNPAHWWHNANIYQIWPRSFKDSDGDGHGDFNGIRQQLPYLKDLHINAIWLTPIFAAPSYHGYDFTDFYQVESDYGSMADFEKLVQDAAQSGIRIILDLVINHISDQHPWFQRSAKGEAPYRDYFIWRTDLPKDGWGPAWDSSKVDPKAVWHYDKTRNAYYYGAFGPSQPDLNLTHPAVVAEMKKMASFWLNKGVAGFRLDAVRYAIEQGPQQQADTADTLAYWQDFTAHVRSVKPDAMLVGEAWADLPIAAKYYSEGKGLDAGFDFEFGYKVLELLQQQGAVAAEFGTMSKDAAAQDGSTTTENLHPLQLNYQARLATQVPLQYFSPFITNHDQPRVGWQLQGHKAKAKLAAAMLFASPGPTYIYYGEEIGMTQASDAEHIHRRAPMLWDKSHQAGFTSAKHSWVEAEQLFPPQQHNRWWAPFLSVQRTGAHSVADQQKDPTSVWSLYKYLLKIKANRPEFAVNASYEAKSLENPYLLQISRTIADNSTIFLLNLSDKSQKIPDAFRQPNGYVVGWSDNDTTSTALGPWQLRIWHKSSATPSTGASTGSVVAK